MPIDNVRAFPHNDCITRRGAAAVGDAEHTVAHAHDGADDYSPGRFHISTSGSGGERTLSARTGHVAPAARSTPRRVVWAALLAPVTLTIVAFLVLVGLWGVASGTRGGAPGRPLLMAAALAELELVVHAVVALAVMAAGHRPDSTGEFLGYVVVTVGMIPFALARARGPHATRFDAVVLGIVCLVTAVAVLRLLSLW
ncbi:MAG: hypothetical protein KDC33_03450 [Thermoleophilia bacterium]|nr:hypothetical protein [Thermoleophilia bacterium]